MKDLVIQLKYTNSAGKTVVYLADKRESGGNTSRTVYGWTPSIDNAIKFDADDKSVFRISQDIRKNDPMADRAREDGVIVSVKSLSDLAPTNFSMSESFLARVKDRITGKKAEKPVQPSKYPNSDNVEEWMEQKAAWHAYKFPNSISNLFDPTMGDYIPLMIATAFGWKESYLPAYRALKDKYPEAAKEARKNFKDAGGNNAPSIFRRGPSEDYLRESTTGENSMTIGSQFLARLNEAKKPATPAPSYKYDAGTETLKKRLREVGSENIADTIAETLNLLGVPGRALRADGIQKSVTEVALELRKKPARVTALLALHSALETASIKEAREEDLEGSAFQKMVEEVISELGYDLGSAEGFVMNSIKRKAAGFSSNAAVKAAFKAFAQKFQIRAADGQVGGRKSPGMKKLGEAANDAMEAGQEDRVTGVSGPFMKGAQELLSKFGVDLNSMRNDQKREVVAKIREAVKDANVRNAITAFNKKTAQ